MCFIPSFHPQPCVQRRGTVVGAEHRGHLWRSRVRAGTPARAEDSRDRAEEASGPFLHDGLLQGAYTLRYAEKDWLKLASTASLRVAGGICIPQLPFAEGSGAAAGTCVGTHGEVLRSPGYSLP